MRLDPCLRHTLAAVAVTAGLLALGLPSLSCASENDGRGVTAKTHGAGTMYSGKDDVTPADKLPKLDNQSIRQLAMMASDPGRSMEAVRRLRGYVQAQTDPAMAGFLRRLLVRALITTEAPVGEIVEQTELAAPAIPQDGSIRTLFYLEAAQALIDRGEAGKSAVAFARKALDAIPAAEARPEVQAYTKGVLGRALLADGQCKPAIAALTDAVPAVPDSQPVLAALGAAYEACGEPKQAIGYYVRSLGVYGSDDSTAAVPLRRLYAAQNGSTRGLDQQIQAAYDASMRQAVFESRRYEAPMPEWRLEDTNGHLVRSQDLAGKVLVLDFWGSWCGPCRMELPHFQSLYEKFKDRGVVFYGINWERADRSQRKAQASAYMKANSFDFPNVFDLEDKTPTAFKVESFPTVFLVDATGQIRYRNIGFSPAISDIMSRQIESLLAESGGAAKK